MITKFYEKNCDIYAIKFFMRAYPEADHEQIVNEVYGRMDKHIKSLPYLDQSEMYNSTYTYDRLRVNQKLVRAHHVSIEKAETEVPVDST